LVRDVGDNVAVAILLGIDQSTLGKWVSEFEETIINV
jgi:hypothetical protein